MPAVPSAIKLSITLHVYTLTHSNDSADSRSGVDSLDHVRLSEKVSLHQFIITTHLAVEC